MAASYTFTLLFEVRYVFFFITIRMKTSCFENKFPVRCSPEKVQFFIVHYNVNFPLNKDCCIWP